MRGQGGTPARGPNPMCSSKLAKVASHGKTTRLGEQKAAPSKQGSATRAAGASPRLAPGSRPEASHETIGGGKKRGGAGLGNGQGRQVMTALPRAVGDGIFRRRGRMYRLGPGAARDGFLKRVRTGDAGRTTMAANGTKTYGTSQPSRRRYFAPLRLTPPASRRPRALRKTTLGPGEEAPAWRKIRTAFPDSETLRS